MGAAVDCESIGQGFLAQPVNASTCVALVLAGFLLLPRPRSRWIGFALVAAGIGSFLFHGPLAPGGIWVHDVTLAWLILVIAVEPWAWGRLVRIPGLVVLCGLFAINPDIGDQVTVIIFAVAVISLLRSDRSGRTVVPLAVLAVSAVVGRLGATGGPWCDPDSVVQTHGLWHIGAATAVAWWALARERLPQDEALESAALD